MILFRRRASATMISAMAFKVSAGSIFFFSNSAELLMIPSGFLISWETPATISPNVDRCLALANWSLRRIRSKARLSMMPSPRLTTKIKVSSKIPITMLIVQITST